MESTNPTLRRYAASDMTRFLCAGVRLDATFANKVIDVLLGDRSRFAAPAYGYDAVPVLGHALDARRLRRARTAAVVLSLMAVIFLVVVSPLGIVGGILLGLWAAWTAIFVERLVALQHLVTYLKAPRPDGAAFDGRYPRSDYLPRPAADEIAEEQDTSTDLVYYGGYLPFVGAGTRVRNWSFTVLLDAAQPLLPNGLGDQTASSAAPEATRFTVDELTSYVAERLGPVLTTESADGQRIEQLDIVRRWYRKAIANVRPDVPRDTAKSLPRSQHGPRLYDSAREYVCVRVGSWDQELVTSVFTSFDLKGRTLYTELHGYVLMPIKPRYRMVDQLPDVLTADTVLRVAWQATKSVLSEIIESPLTAFLALRGAYRGAVNRGSARSSLDAEDLTRYAEDLTDHGARTSIRELAAVDDFRHFFQEIDAKKYITIIERRLLEVVLDFLEDKKVDTREYRDRQAAVLNYGIIYSGSGNVVNTGTQALGPNSSAVNRTSAPK